METIVIAGGTGLVGKKLVAFWRAAGHEVRVLTRGTAVGSGEAERKLFHWDPSTRTLDPQALEGMTVLVNLSGAGVAEKRWTKTRKAELIASRIGTTELLREKANGHPTLKQYITASGINSYGFEAEDRLHMETDPFGTDFVADLTRQWEEAADRFQNSCPVTKLRIGMVLTKEGGALPTLAGPIRYGFGAAFGKGTQGIPWLHIDDLVAAFDHAMTQDLEGVYNTHAGNTDNETLTKTIAAVLNKSLWLPRVPGGILKLALGELSILLLRGVKADNSKLRNSGFVFHYAELAGALSDLLKKK